MRISISLFKSTHLNWMVPSVGLEIHAQICSKNKIFSSGPAGSRDPSPNSALSLFDVAIPGTMPVVNKECVKAGVLTALALRSRINPVSYFDRKHYFYPDLPGGYQISQNRVPLAEGGYLPINNNNNNNNEIINVLIKQIQLEQDSGKIVFGEKTTEGHETLIDYRRAGVGLMEIVTEPVLIDGSSAANFIHELRLLLKRIGTCDGNMADGSLRVDANISVRETGSDKMGTRTEIKNINGIKHLKKAIDYEISRHMEVLNEGGVVLPETRSYDERKNLTTPTRGKSAQQDYRFIEEHDVPVLLIGREGITNIDECRRILEEIPPDNVGTLSLKYGISLYDVQVLKSEEWAIDFFEEIMKQCPELPVKLVVSWITSELYGLVDDREGINVCGHNFTSLLALLHQNKLTGPQAKKILRLMVEGDSRSPIDIVHDIQTTHYSHSDIVNICETILTEHKEQVSEYITNDKRRKRLFGFFMGEAMSLTGRDCDPLEIKEILMKLLNNKI